MQKVRSFGRQGLEMNLQMNAPHGIDISTLTDPCIIDALTRP